MKLKQLNQFLPFNLKVNYKFLEFEQICDLKGIDFQLESIRIESNCNTIYTDIKTIKPILKPKGDLIKPVKGVNGDYLPISLFALISIKEQKAFDLYGEIPPYWQEIMELDLRSLEYRHCQILIEHKFDVFDWIDKGLAIDINTVS